MRVLSLIVALLTLAACGGTDSETGSTEDSPTTDAEKILFVASFGGTGGDAIEKVYFEPFERATGIRVVVAGEPDAAQLKTMVQSGVVEWDVALMTDSQTFALQAEDLLTKIDYSRMDPSVVNGISEFKIDYGVPLETFASVIVWNTEAFPGTDHPTSWADVWDTTRFPGRRSLAPGTNDPPLFEIPLLADGVAASDLYPIDFNRVFSSYDKIESSTIFSEVSERQELLTSGEAVIGTLSSGRASAARDEGAPIDFVWNQALLQVDYWVIPKGAPHPNNALAFLEFQAEAKNQAAFSEIVPNGPVNKDAFEFIPSAVADTLPNAPSHVDQIVVVDAEYWAQTNSSGESNVARGANLWNEWLSR